MFIAYAVTPAPYTLPANSIYRSLLNVRTSQGKVAELRSELQMGGGKKDKMNQAKKIALKKIVANMTMSNNDMVALFPDIIGCMGIQSLEIKKMLVKCARAVRGTTAEQR